ncbi:MAG: tRNA lysidine(34) synthetase TilS [Alphaproteobacteria bacterium]|nr:tRNA lysidine(34) synthetase TilS [Alphaproteobacteria bacterium]
MTADHVDSPLPIVASALKNALADVAPDGVALLAVSGGGDSMGMLAAAASLEKPRARFAVATVDHGIRPDSRHDAALVAEACAAYDIPCAILAWGDPHGGAGLQAAAREARYRLLATHAAAIGANAILTAHTADDLAETFLMRLARGSGAAGLASMLRPVRVAAGPSGSLPLIRPFLAVRRARMRMAALDFGLAVTDDPSNDDRRFERVRARSFLASGDDTAGLAVEPILATCRRLARVARIEDEAIARRAADLGVQFEPSGVVTFRLFAPAPDFDAPLLARAIHAVSGGIWPPSDAAAADALGEIVGGARKLSLGGAIVEAAPAGLMDRNGGWRIRAYREPSAILGRAGVSPIAPAALAPGETILWDRRFVIANRTGGMLTAMPAGALDAEPACGIDPAGSTAPTLVDESGRVRASPEQSPEAFVWLGPERFRGGVVRY